MRILLLADSKPGVFVSKFLKEQKENITGLCLHDKKYQNNSDEIIKNLELNDKNIFCVKNIKSMETLEFVKKSNPDIILSIYWRYILPETIIDLPKYGCVNYHPAFLPYNRGKNPNFWPIIEETPAGVSLHYIDSGIDTGKVISQKKVFVEPVDTGGSLYKKLEIAFKDLFIETWPMIKKNDLKLEEQNLSEGTFHYSKDFNKVGLINLNEKYKASDLINLLRAKTFPGKPGAYFLDNGKKIYLKLELSYE